MAKNDQKIKAKGLDDLSYLESLSAPIPKPDLAYTTGTSEDDGKDNVRTKKAQPDQISP